MSYMGVGWGCTGCTCTPPPCRAKGVPPSYQILKKKEGEEGKRGRRGERKKRDKRRKKSE